MKLDISLPWENRKPLTLNALAEAAGQGTKWTSTLGPTSLRRTAGSGVNPASALFMSEVARTSTLTPAQLTANGRSVTVDLERIDEEDGVDSIPIRALSVHGGRSLSNNVAGYADSPGNRRTGQFSLSSFLPSRPDDASASSLGAVGANGVSGASSVVAKGGSSIARPDHIINGSGASAGAGGNTRPQSAAVKSSAATLLSAGLTGSAGAGSNSTGSVDKSRVSMTLQGRPSFGGQEKPLGNVTESPPQPEKKKLLNKMASFFQGR